MDLPSLKHPKDIGWASKDIGWALMQKHLDLLKEIEVNYQKIYLYTVNIMDITHIGRFTLEEKLK